ncbi:undecaprenyldiphospho-muramoylpentapeptide beta-N-acetylglucosaminyltransferase [Paenarthrobacter sp. Z7-10]|uniref:undecaprenyldiphospho-muramoylpentapeptide beta-N-acetylglucosaminyltransferase n=1 Tax=Paenarthrobacter sp. Z7-10 TaxID=2787635 RepID=UPI0022A995A5|nr:undecaprenyldiphospho-muramoylpentapeptide beta-N-acetylglucosaminyltransferase [Paenarthrobacter sp. Z7-10]MCZ2402361.1 undecaprenyldiphospho-muramoylpentapeptide beta-N-acetylglucosaminyltransferase [Paenarthrobacter sp. Z7-10]
MTTPFPSASGATEGSLSVVLAGGGSAGHVSPLLAIAKALRRARPDASVLAVGTTSGLETRLVPAAGFELVTIDRVPFPRRPSADLLRLPARLRAAIRQSGAILEDAKADVLVGVGGYVCTPMYLAARKRGIPIVIHEANSKAGLANRLGARFASAVGTAFEAVEIKDGQLVGMPMRPEISGLDRAGARQQARAMLGLEPQRATLIITGGSLGAQQINRTIAGSLPALEAAGVQMLHITGAGKQVLAADGSPLAGPHYRQVEYIDSMELAYAAADVLLCRSGAGTVCEVAAVGLPAVFVPLPVGNGEQALNASALVAAGAALLVRDAHFNPAWVSAELLPLLADDARLESMAEHGRKLGIRDADERMARMVLEAAQR